ncbi:MAG TPA: hypothetical protein VHE30_07705 [Polyangiaceae bacterium]|nr:hypothetical protein [Polyangiaceae bacterium]
MRPAAPRLGTCVVTLVWLTACGRIGFSLQSRGSPDGVGGGAARDGAPGDDASSGGSGGAPDAGPGAGGSTETGGAPPGGGGTDEGGAAGSAVDAGRGGQSGGVTDSGARDSSPRDAPGCPAIEAPDYCEGLPFLPSPPVIDGVPECGLVLRPLTPVGWTGGATAPDASADYAIAWRPDGIYYFVRVRDPSLVPAAPERQNWQGDCVELYADDDGDYVAPPAYDDPGSRQLVVAAPPPPLTSDTRGQLWAFGVGGPVEWTSSLFGSFATSDGYVVEALVVAADLSLSSLSLVSGAHVGVDLSVGVSFPTDQGPDAGPADNRLGQYFLRTGALDGGTTVLPPFDVRAFCRPALMP